MIYNHTLEIQNRILAVHFGSSQVLENTRKVTIAQVLDFVAIVKAFYPEMHVAFSGVLPRPVDFSQMAQSVINYNHAIHTAVNVASRRYDNIKYVAHHHLFTNSDGQYIDSLFHKKQLRVSRKGAAIVMQNMSKLIITG